MSAVQDLPRCFGCEEEVTHDPVFAATCGDQRHASAVWHPLCLMDHRENLERARARMKAYIAELQREDRS